MLKLSELSHKQIETRVRSTRRPMAWWASSHSARFMFDCSQYRTRLHCAYRVSVPCVFSRVVMPFPHSMALFGLTNFWILSYRHFSRQLIIPFNPWKYFRLMFFSPPRFEQVHIISSSTHSTMVPGATNDQNVAAFADDSFSYFPF